MSVRRQPRLTGGLGKIDDGADRVETVPAGWPSAPGAPRTAPACWRAGAAGSSALGMPQAAQRTRRRSRPAASIGAEVAGRTRETDKGTQKLIAAGQNTTQTYSELVAIMKAGAERANASSMAYGAPEGAVGLTAYSYKIKGASGEGNRNLVRTLGGVVLLGGAIGGLALRRRLI